MVAILGLRPINPTALAASQAAREKSMRQMSTVPNADLLPTGKGRFAYQSFVPKMGFIGKEIAASHQRLR
jgi:hypothetical protein